jgi:hypothetical protein
MRPGVFDGGTPPADTVATLERFAHALRADAPVAVVNGERFLPDVMPNVGLVRGIRAAALGARVRR